MIQDGAEIKHFFTVSLLPVRDWSDSDKARAGGSIAMDHSISSKIRCKTPHKGPR
jgi:hypothetical protein